MLCSAEILSVTGSNTIRVVHYSRAESRPRGILDLVM